MEGIKKILNPDLFDMYLDDRVISTWFKEEIDWCKELDEDGIKQYSITVNIL